MKILTERKEIAKAINFGKYPVLVLDMDNHKGYEKYNPDTKFCEGQRVRVAWDRSDYEGMTSNGSIMMGDDGTIYISGRCAILQADFGYSDVMEDATWANAPVIHKGQRVVVIMDWSKEKRCMVRMMKVSDRIDIHCQRVATLEDIDE